MTSPSTTLVNEQVKSLLWLNPEPMNMWDCFQINPMGDIPYSFRLFSSNFGDAALTNLAVPSTPPLSHLGKMATVCSWWLALPEALYTPITRLKTALHYTVVTLKVNDKPVLSERGSNLLARNDIFLPLPRETTFEADVLFAPEALKHLGVLQAYIAGSDYDSPRVYLHLAGFRHLGASGKQ